MLISYCVHTKGGEWEVLFDGPRLHSVCYHEAYFFNRTQKIFGHGQVT